MNTYFFDIEVKVYVNEAVVAESREQAMEIMEAYLGNDGYVEHEMRDLVAERADNEQFDENSFNAFHCNVWPDYEEPGARDRAVRYLGKEVYGEE